MKTTTLSKIRNEQKKQLEFAICELQTAEENVKKAFNSYNDNHTIDFYYNVITPLDNIVDDIKNRINYLTIELYENKYANKLIGSNIYPFEVIKEINVNEYIIREMRCSETEKSINERNKSLTEGCFAGHYDNFVQDWIIESDISKEPFKIRRHKDGQWYDKNGMKYAIKNKPIKFYDFNK